ncbi:MAG: alpha-glucan family phosphorylase [Candidatus Dormibacteria bacterium]
MTEAAATTELRNGTADIETAAGALAERLPNALGPFARVAYNYRWSWDPEARDLFRRIDAARFELCNENPVRLLTETSAAALQSAAGDALLIDRAHRALRRLSADVARPDLPGRASARRPVAFLCAEFAIHRSLPIYAGGLGALAGDILKEASDMAVPMVGVGLLYREGYFLQRVDSTGYQHEYWHPVDPDRLPAALVCDVRGRPLTVPVPVRGRDVVVQIWRVEVGRVPLYLLDADRPENSRADRWITGRLYVADRATRLAQYALLGIGSMRALWAMGLDPAVVHLNEGHGALAALELARFDLDAGRDRHEAFARARERIVFTTHTPVAAGNEGYDLAEVDLVLGGYPEQVGLDRESFLHLGRTNPDNPHEPFVMTPLGIKMSRFANGVSRRHGEVARQMWQPLFPERPVDTVPVGHVTNGVHVPSWMAPAMRHLLDRHLPDGWIERADDPAVWKPVADIPDADLWAVRGGLRAGFIEYARDRTIANRLARSDPREYVEAAERGFSPDSLTIGFARRLATYKRLYILTMEPQRIQTLLTDESHPMQLFLAGKAHPNDEEGKRSPQGLFALNQSEPAAGCVSFLDNYDLGVAAQLVAGCDLWVNLPRPPLEASGTSGMKSALNGGLNLSILDGWWAEAFNGENGWGLPGDVSFDNAVQDQRDAAVFYDVLEHEVAPLFYDRGEDGIPHGWVARIKSSLMTNGPRFSSTRMVRDYVDAGYVLQEHASR